MSAVLRSTGNTTLIETGCSRLRDGARCGAERDRLDHAYCRACRAEYARERYRARGTTPARRAQWKACRAIRAAVKAGYLLKEPCACGSWEVQGSAADPENPLESVAWACRPCRRAHRRATRIAAETEADNRMAELALRHVRRR